MSALQIVLNFRLRSNEFVDESLERRTAARRHFLMEEETP